MPVDVPTMVDFQALSQRVSALEAASPHPTPGGRRLIGVYSAGETNVERHSRIFLTRGTPYTFYSVISVPLTNLQAGDEIQVSAEAQVSHTNANWWMIASIIVAGATPDASTGIELCEHVAENFSGSVHHKPVFRLGRFVVPPGMTATNINFILYAAHTQAVVGTSHMVVDPDYGRMHINHYR